MIDLYELSIFFLSTVCFKKVATRIIISYSSRISDHWMMIFISLKSSFFPLSNDPFFVEIGQIEEEKSEKTTPEKLIIILTINKNKNLRPLLHCFKGAKSFIKFTLHLRLRQLID